MNKQLIFNALLLGLLAMAGCARKSSAPATTYAAPSVAVTDSLGRTIVPGEGINREREQLVGRIDTEMKDLDRQIEDLEKQERDISRQRRDLTRQQKRLRRTAKDLSKYDATAEWQNRKEQVNKMLEKAEKRN
ncbi:MAG: hypothetical protein LH606_07415 [Cytophagaceae bacterium]|nr:hypothetical protein [Cytophagaceae bacterium]